VSEPVLSIVIPVRDRLDKLTVCVQTIVNANLDSSRVEVVVSDNSAEGIPTDASPLQSPQVRVVRPESPLHMTDNFEFGRRAATGQWMLFLGADDGVVSSRLRAFVDHLETCKSDCVVGPTVGFSWPDMSERHEGRLSWWIAQTSDPSVVDARQALEAVVASIQDPSALDSGSLPMPYMHGAVRTSALSRLAQGPHDQVFRTQAPDIYIMMALLHTISSFEVLPWAIGIQGVSRQSNGQMSLARAQEWSNHPDRAITISEQAVGVLSSLSPNSDIVATYKDAMLTAAEVSGWPVKGVYADIQSTMTSSPKAAARRLAFGNGTKSSGFHGRISRLSRRLGNASRRISIGQHYYVLRSVALSDTVQASDAVATIDYVESQNNPRVCRATESTSSIGLRAFVRGDGSRGWRLSSRWLVTPFVYQAGGETR
jgi:hypothetical protein